MEIGQNRNWGKWKQGKIEMDKNDNGRQWKWEKMEMGGNVNWENINGGK